MSSENNFKLIKLSEEDIERKKQNIDFGMVNNTGLDADAINAWASTLLLKAVKHYEEYFRYYDPQLADYIMEKTSPEKIKEFDQLVDEYNSQLEQIRKNNDQAAAKSYLDKAVKLIRG